MKSIVLTVVDRIILPQILPSQGGKIEMLLVESIIRMVEFTPKEVSEYEIKDGLNGMVSFNPEKAKEREYDLSPEQVEALKNGSKKVDEEKKVTRQNLSLISKIDSI